MVDAINRFVVTYSTTGELGKLLGTVNYHSYTTFAADINKAFGKTLPSTDSLVVKVEFMTQHRGVAHMVMDKTDYATKLSTIQTLLTAADITLESLFS